MQSLRFRNGCCTEFLSLLCQNPGGSFLGSLIVVPQGRGVSWHTLKISETQRALQNLFQFPFLLEPGQGTGAVWSLALEPLCTYLHMDLMRSFRRTGQSSTENSSTFSFYKYPNPLSSIGIQGISHIHDPHFLDFLIRAINGSVQGGSSMISGVSKLLPHLCCSSW